MNEASDRPDWPARPWLLAALGAIAGLVVHFLIDRAAVFPPPPLAPWRLALAGIATTGATLIVFTLERERARWALAFAAIAALVVGGVVYWNGAYDGWGAAEGWRIACAFLAVAIAAPLFQVARDEGGWRFPYDEVHAHAWTNVVMWCAGWVFVGVVMLLAYLLSELFQLIGIGLLERLMREGWFMMPLIGASGAAAVGLLRERDRIVRLLLGVVLTVLRVLAPVLAAGLALFLASLPFTGLAPLWDATRSTTPILLACIIGALILANAVIGNGTDDEARGRLLRWSAIALAAALLPLAAIAAVSTGARIAQYGFTPDRLWALVFVGVAVAYGLAYLVALVRRRDAWSEAVRPANLQLGFGLCGLALVLALPVLSFNTISARDQVARLRSGAIAPARFDWAALAFDFGEPGKRLTRALARNGDPQIARQARFALTQTSRWDARYERDRARAAEIAQARIHVLPRPTSLPFALRRALISWDACGDVAACTVFYAPGAAEAVSVRPQCGSDAAQFGGDCAPVVARLVRDGAIWRVGAVERSDADRKARNVRLARDQARGALSIRPVARRQVFVGDEPVGGAFE